MKHCKHAPIPRKKTDAQLLEIHREYLRDGEKQRYCETCDKWIWGSEWNGDGENEPS